VTLVGDRAEVVLTVNGDYESWTYYRRDSDGWHETVSGNGPTVGWEDPRALQW